MRNQQNDLLSALVQLPKDETTAILYSSVFMDRASILRVCTNGALSPIHIPCPTMQHFLSHSPHQTVTHDHLLTLVVHVASHHRLLAILVHRGADPFVILEMDHGLSE